jgi:hypothetical protein
MNERKAEVPVMMAKWAAIAKEVQGTGKFMDVGITTRSCIIRDYTVEDLYFEKHLSENEKHVNRGLILKLC